MPRDRLPLLLIDNYDSFTYNLSHLLAKVNGATPHILRNDECVPEALDLFRYAGVVISPGPGRPERAADFGIGAAALRRASVPTLGVCLGHQGIGDCYGATVELAPVPMHGRVSRVRHRGGRLFRGVPEVFEAVRYHSLVVAAPLPSALLAMAWSDDGQIMALRALDRPLWGVQFHPESVLTAHGETLLRNFTQWCEEHNSAGVRGGAKRSRADGAGKPSEGARPPQVNHRPSRRLRVRVREHAGETSCEDLFYACFQDSPSAFWLDSSRVIDGYSRFSYLGDGSGPLAERLAYRVKAHEVRRLSRGADSRDNGDIFTALRDGLRVDVDAPNLPFDFLGGYIGYLGYELKGDCGGDSPHCSPYPDAQFLFVDRLIVVDHLRRKTWLLQVLDESMTDELAERWFARMAQTINHLSAAPVLQPGRAATPVRFRLRHGREDYLRMIRQCRQAIREGESYEICLTNMARWRQRVEPFALYRALRAFNAAPYAAYLRFDDMAVLCSSPERFLKIDPQGRMEAKPIKGTTRRAEEPQIDRQLRDGLADSEKDRAENLMIVDLLRNDLGVVAAPGSVRVPKLMAIESYATVHQMVSTVVGQLADDCHPLDAVRAAFPGGSMTGAPKRRTMAIIDELEAGPRGIYSGAIGFLSLNGAVDLNIVIRTLVADPGGLTLGAGGAITWLSDAEAEYDEMLLKADATARAVGWSWNGDGDGMEILPTIGPSTDQHRRIIA